MIGQCHTFRARSTPALPNSWSAFKGQALSCQFFASSWRIVEHTSERSAVEPPPGAQKDRIFEWSASAKHICAAEQLISEGQASSCQSLARCWPIVENTSEPSAVEPPGAQKDGNFESWFTSVTHICAAEQLINEGQASSCQSLARSWHIVENTSERSAVEPPPGAQKDGIFEWPEVWSDISEAPLELEVSWLISGGWKMNLKMP